MQSRLLRRALALVALTVLGVVSLAPASVAAPKHRRVVSSLHGTGVVCGLRGNQVVIDHTGAGITDDGEDIATRGRMRVTFGGDDSPAVGDNMTFNFEKIEWNIREQPGSGEPTVYAAKGRQSGPGTAVVDGKDTPARRAQFRGQFVFGDPGDTPVTDCS